MSAHSIPFATLSADKSVLSEASPLFLGIYGGRRSTPSSVTTQVDSADAILDIGGIILEDFATGLWTTQLAPSKLITLGDHFVRVGNQLFVDLHLADVLDALAAATLPRWSANPTPTPVTPLPLAGEGAEPTSSAALYPRLQRLLRPGDTIVAEQGSCMIHLGGLRLPDGVGFQAQTLWGSIGWATAATLGVTMAKAAGRTILVTGDGSHQLTANEIGVMGRYGAKPIIFVLRNDIYGVEDVLSEVGLSYDDLARWNYVQIPAAMGCTDWFAAHARTVAELDAAIATAQTHDGGSYIVVDIPQAESVPIPKAVQDHLYKP